MYQPAPVTRFLHRRRGGALGYLRQLRHQAHPEAVRRLLARGVGNGSGTAAPLARAPKPSSAGGRRERSSSYRLHENEHLAAAVRHAAREQLDDAIEQLTVAIGDDPVTAVHEARTEVLDDQTIRFHFPEPDGLAVGKMRGFHIASPRFWRESGFGYRKLGTGEGHW